MAACINAPPPAICSASALVSAVAVAACTFSLAGAAQVDYRPTLIQFMPAGEFEPSDGRAMDVPAWCIDADSVRSFSSLTHHAAKGVLQRFRVREVHRIGLYAHLHSVILVCLFQNI